MPIPQEALDAVGHNNVKTIGEAGAFYAAQMMADTVGDARAFAEIRRASTAASVKLLLEADPIEAISVQKVLSGNDTASTLAQLLAALNSGQQGTKSAQTTPPVTP